MARLKSLHLLGLLPLMGACTTVPVPKTVTGLDTYQIVQRARCEVRDAIRDRAAHYAREELKRPDLALAIQAGQVDFVRLARELPDPKDRLVFDRYRNSSIAYEFTFDMQVKDAASAGAGFQFPLGFGKVTFGIKGSRDKTRKNSRNFRILDNFGNLTFVLKDRICDAVTRPAGNLNYPITGTLGLENIVATFLDLNQSGNLTGEDTPPTIADTITFDTVLTGKTDPEVVLVPASSTKRLTGATFSVSQVRTDKHTLVIAITMPPPDTGGRKPASITEERALAELERQRQRRLEDEGQTLRLVGPVPDF